MGVRNEKAAGFYYVVQDNLRVLYADDDPILREFAVVHLSTESAEVVTAEDGVAALQSIEESLPDILLLDLEMPRMDGFEALQRLRANPSTERLPIIVVTGREDVAAIDRAFEAGATAFVAKPINWRLLSYQIRYVHRSHLTEERLARAAAEARAGESRARRLMARIAGEGQRFIAAALAAAPALRPRATDFADALEGAVAPEPQSDPAEAA